LPSLGSPIVWQRQLEPNGERKEKIMGNQAILSRYTTWSAFKYWLDNNVILFGTYANWEDKSDVALLNAYAERIGKRVRVICLMDRSENIEDCYYHWKCYANEKDGIRIDFNKNMLQKTLKNKKGIEINGDEVKYKEQKNLAKDTKKIPFLKRTSYNCDKEFRFICEGNANFIKKSYPYEYGVGKDFFKKCIEGIRFSHSMPSEKMLEIKSFLRKKGIKEDVYSSKIMGDERWETMILNANQE